MGLFLLGIPKLNLSVSNPNTAGFVDPKFAWLAFGVGLLLIFVYQLPKLLVGGLARLQIVDANLIIKNPAKSLNQIPIADIESVGLRYEVASINTSGPSLAPFPNAGSLIRNYRYYVRQWGNLVKTKNGQVYEIKQSVENFNDFLQELKNINPAITQSQELEEQSRQQAEEDFKKTPSFTQAKTIVWDKDL